MTWKSETGEILGKISDSRFLLSNLSELLYEQPGSCARYIDPAGDACFNQLQLPNLLTELQQVRAKILDASEIEQMDNVIALVSRANGTTHSYVWFVGD